jgi:hypothetical protein
VGSTGRGKSTMLNFLCKDQSLRVEENLQGYCIYVDGETTIGSLNSFQSKTLHPNVVKDKEEGVFVVDLAGFQDTRGPLKDVTVAFTNKLVLESAKTLKIIIVEDYQNLQLNKDRGAFIASISFVAKLLGENIDACHSAIGVVATKIDSTLTDSKLVKSLDCFLGEVQKSDVLDDDTRKLLKFVTQTKNYGIFRQPREVGDGTPYSTGALKKNLESLRQMVFKRIPFSEKLCGKFQVTVAHAAVLYAIELVESSQVSIDLAETVATIFKQLKKKFEITSEILKSQGLEKFVKTCNDFASSIVQITSNDTLEFFAKEKQIDKKLIESWQFQLKKTQLLLNLAGTTFTDMEENVNDFFGAKQKLLDWVQLCCFQRILTEYEHELKGYSVQKHNAALRNIFSEISVQNYKQQFNELTNYGFSEKLIKVSMQTQIDKKQVQQIKALASELTHDPAKGWRQEQDTWIYEGCLVMLSEIWEKVSTSDPLPNEVIITSSQKLFIDSDIQLQDTHLVILSPEIIVVGESRTIHMRGEHGRPHSETHATRLQNVGMNGRDGLDGNSGYSSGNVRIYAHKGSIFGDGDIVLLIKSEGGNGGDGQNGEHGKNASNNCLEPEMFDPSQYTNIDVHDGLIEIAKQLNDDAVVYDYRTARIYLNYGAMYDYAGDDFYFNDEFKLKLSKFSNDPPTNGGNGGSAGSGAVAGSIEVAFQNEEFRNNHTHLENFHGCSGNPGAGGSPGINTQRGKQKIFEIKCQRLTCTYGSFFNPKRLNVYRYSVWPDSFSPFEIRLLETNDHPDTYANALCGNEGLEAPRINFPVYKHTQMTPLSRIVQDYVSAVLINSSSPLNILTKRFLDYLMTSRYFLAQCGSCTDYFSQLEKLELLQRTRKLPTANLCVVYEFIYKSFKAYQALGVNVDPLYSCLMEALIASRLDMLRVSDGRQITNLNFSLDRTLKKISSFKETSTLVLRFENVSLENKHLLAEFEEANDWVSTRLEREITQLKSDIDTSFEGLTTTVHRHNDIYLSNITHLQHHEIEIARVAKIEATFGILRAISQLAAIIWTPAVAIEVALAKMEEYASAGTPDPNLAAYSVQIFQGVEHSRRLIERIDIEYQERQDHIQKFISDLLNSDKRDYLPEEATQIAREWQNEADGVKHEMVTFVYGLAEKLETMSEIVNNGIEKLDENSHSEEIEFLKSVNKKLEIARHVASAASTFVKTLNNYNMRSNVMNNILAAINKNQEALVSIAEFERRLRIYFKPLLSEIINKFESTGLDLVNQSGSMLQCTSFDTKRNLKKILNLIGQFTQGFDSDQERFRKIFQDLQDFLITAAKVYDKMHDLKFRMRLVSLMGHLDGVDVNASTEQYLRKVKLEVFANDITREFKQLFAAFQNCTFPYGMEKVGILKKAISAISREECIQDKIDLLQDNLIWLKNEIIESRSLIDNKKDSNIFTQKFCSDYKSTRPFYVWSKSQFYREITNLLNGKKVTLEASVTAKGVKNAVKFSKIMLNMKVEDETVRSQVVEILNHFNIIMTHSGENHFKCGTNYYTISSQKIKLCLSFERDESGNYVSENRTNELLSQGDVTLSPYTIWTFELVSSQDEICHSERIQEMRKKLVSYANKLDLELIGIGTYVKDKAAICNEDLGQFYTLYEC